MTDDDIKVTIRDSIKCEIDKYNRALCWVLLVIIIARLFAHFGLMRSTLPQFENMFKEMDIGELPFATKLVFMMSNSWLLLITLFFGGAIICHVKRLWGVMIIEVGVLAFVQQFASYALFLPITTIFERLGK